MKRVCLALLAACLFQAVAGKAATVADKFTVYNLGKERVELYVKASGTPRYPPSNVIKPSGRLEVQLVSDDVFDCILYLHPDPGTVVEMGVRRANLKSAVTEVVGIPRPFVVTFQKWATWARTSGQWHRTLIKEGDRESCEWLCVDLDGTVFMEVPESCGAVVVTPVRPIDPKKIQPGLEAPPPQESAQR